MQFNLSNEYPSSPLLVVRQASGHLRQAEGLSLPLSLKLTFEQRQLLELDILRVAVAGGALRLLGLLLEGSLGEGVYPVHEGP